VGLGSLCPAEGPKALSELKLLSHDGRWRTREGVAMALQRILARSGVPFARGLEGWVSDEDWRQMRAVVAGVAEPPLLKRDPALARAALELHQRVISRLQGAKDRRSDPFKVLRQALGYSLSVVVAQLGPEGFEYMRALSRTDDEDVEWILKENLKKDRLKRSSPDDVTDLLRELGKARG
jgi:hypothetical protein